MPQPNRRDSFVPASVVWSIIAANIVGMSTIFTRAPSLLTVSFRRDEWSCSDAVFAKANPRPCLPRSYGCHVNACIAGASESNRNAHAILSQTALRDSETETDEMFPQRGGKKATSTPIPMIRPGGERTSSVGTELTTMIARRWSALLAEGAGSAA